MTGCRRYRACSSITAEASAIRDRSALNEASSAPCAKTEVRYEAHPSILFDQFVRTEKRIKRVERLFRIPEGVQTMKF